MRTRWLLLLAVFLGPSFASSAHAEVLHTFRQIQLHNQFWSEGAAFVDLNNDGKMDYVAGPYWWEGPGFKKRHTYYPATRTFQTADKNGKTITVPGFEGALGTKNAYSDNFFVYGHDFDKDGWHDLLVIGFPGKDTSWFKNPGKVKGEPAWQRFLVLDPTDNESPTFGDLTGDGVPELICASNGRYGYAQPDPSDATKPWIWHPVTEPISGLDKFTHGLGFGDVDGDGRADLVDRAGYWSQPESLRGDPVWQRTAVDFGPGGAQMHVYDVNGDGRNDIVTALRAHGYGLAWFENTAGPGGKPTFVQHIIMDEDPAASPYGLALSQLHGVEMVDIDGDGVKDIVTGKRFWAHGPNGDPGSNDPAGIYWFRVDRRADCTVDFIPYLIDPVSGIGTGIVVGDVNGDGLPDLAIANKKGAYIYAHVARKVSPAEWQKAQPQRKR